MWYFANPTTPKVRAAMTRGQLAAILTPKQGNSLPDGALCCVDNGCGPGKGGKPGTGYPGDRDYFRMLARLADQTVPDYTDPDLTRCMFAVAPDVPYNAAATLDRSHQWLWTIRELNLPAALAAQNGLEHLTVPWDDFDVLFIGGDDAWKLGPGARRLVAEALTRRKWVHMGRVNSLKRLRYAQAIGCDSADGTYLICTRQPDLYLPVVLGWQQTVDGQAALFDMVGSA